MGLGCQQITSCWAKIWMPINSSWITEYYNSERTDVTISFKDNEEPYLLSCAMYQTLCQRFYQHNFIGFSKQPQWVAIDIHILKRKEQRLKEVESLSQCHMASKSWNEDSNQVYVFLKAVLFLSTCYYLNTQKGKWLAQDLFTAQTRTWNPCSWSLSLTQSSYPLSWVPAPPFYPLLMIQSRGRKKTIFVML